MEPIQRNFLSHNLRVLRKKMNLSQEQLAENLGITRSKLASYEVGNTVPGVDSIMKISRFFKISLDLLLMNELKGNDGMDDLDDSYFTGEKIRVLATTVDNDDEENIELVPLKVKAGYTAGYNDPEFVKTLPVFQLPFLSRDRKYRAFQIEGDSMLPIKHGSYVVGEFILNWRALKDGEAVVILTENDGAVFKIMYRHAKSKNKVLLKSLNPLFEPYEMDMAEIREIWKFKYYFTDHLPDELSTNDILLMKLSGIEQKLDLTKN